MVFQTGVSARLPGAADAVPNGWDMDEFLSHVAQKSTEGKQGHNVWLVHNHPSGNPSPSQADLRVTQRIADRMELYGVGFGGHVVINHERYSVISGRGNHVELPIEQPGSYDVNKPKKAHKVLDETIESPLDVARLAKMVEAAEGNIVLIGRNREGTRLVSEVTPTQMASKRAPAIIHRLALESGS